LGRGSGRGFERSGWRFDEIKLAAKEKSAGNIQNTNKWKKTRKCENSKSGWLHLLATRFFRFLPGKLRGPTGKSARSLLAQNSTFKNTELHFGHRRISWTQFWPRMRTECHPKRLVAPVPSSQPLLSASMLCLRLLNPICWSFLSSSSASDLVTIKCSENYSL
jgi:hypothetical protein